MFFATPRHDINIPIVPRNALFNYFYDFLTINTKITFAHFRTYTDNDFVTLS